MSAREVRAAIVVCDLCDDAKGPPARSIEIAEAMAALPEYDLIVPWPRNGRHACLSCRDFVNGKIVAPANAKAKATKEGK